MRPPPTGDRGPRFLLGIVTALIAATPLVSAGDPGRGPMSTATGHLYLTAGWFVALAAWAVWNLWTKPGRRVVCVVGLGLIATAGIIAVRAAWAPDRWLAWRVAWDWAAVAAAFVVVRQIAIDREDVRGLFAAVIATGVAALVWPIVPWFAAAVGVNWPEVASVPESDFWTGPGETGIVHSIHSARWLAWLFLIGPALPGLAHATLLPIRWPARLAALFPLVFVFAAFPCLPPEKTPDNGSWSPAMDMVRDHLNGVGPGQYSRFAARYTPPNSEWLLTEPSGYYIGLAATCGVAALASLLMTLGILLPQMVKIVWRSTMPGNTARSDVPADQALPPARPRTEYYAGGIGGLLIGFVLQVGDLPPGSVQPIRELGVAAAFGGLCWFATFAIADSTLRLISQWPSIPVGCIVLMSVASVFLNLLSAPDIALLFWVLAALALGFAAPLPLSAWAKSTIGRFVPLLVALPLAAGFVVLIAYPGITAANYVWQARLTARKYPALRKTVEQANDQPKKIARRDAAAFIDRAILRPLTQAVRADPDAAGPLLEQVPWWLAVWELGALVKADENAVIAARAARERDPESVASYLAELRVRLRFAEVAPNKRADQFRHADELIGEVVQRDPARAARLRYQVARVYFAVKDEKNGTAAAGEALRLNADAPGPRYRLRDDERAQVRTWLKLPADGD